MKRLITLIVSLVLVLAVFPAAASAQGMIVLYHNDTQWISLTTNETDLKEIMDEATKAANNEVPAADVKGLIIKNGTLTLDENLNDSYPIVLHDTTLTLTENGNISSRKVVTSGDGKIIASNDGIFGIPGFLTNGKYSLTNSSTDASNVNEGNTASTPASYIKNEGEYSAITLEGGILTLTNISDTKKIAAITGGATLDIADKSFTIDSGTSLTNKGAISGTGALSIKGTLINEGTISAPIKIEGSGKLVNKAGITSDLIEVTGGTVENNGTIAGKVVITEGTFTNSGELADAVTVTKGKLNNLSSGIIKGDVVIQADGGLSNAGTLKKKVEINGGKFTNEKGGVVEEQLTLNGAKGAVNSGTINAHVKLQNQGEMTNAGSISSGNTITLEGGSQLVNTGVIKAKVVLSGGSTFDTYNGTFGGNIDVGSGNIYRKMKSSGGGSVTPPDIQYISSTPSQVTYNGTNVIFDLVGANHHIVTGVKIENASLTRGTQYFAETITNGARVTVSKAYLSTLSPGTYSVKVILAGGYFNGKITIPGSTPTPPPVISNQYRVIVSTRLNGRTGPGTNYSVVAKYRANTILQVLSVSNGWGYTSQGTYVSMRYLVPFGNVGTGVYYTTANLNYRTGPGTGYGIITTIPKNTPVVVVGSSGTWLQINYNGTTGYVSGAYVR